MNKILLSTPNHYLYPVLQQLNYFQTYESEKDYSTYDLIVDLSLTSKKEKFNFVKKYEHKIISDVTLIDHHNLICRGKISTVFPSPNKKCEVVAHSDDQVIMSEVLAEIGLTPLFVQDPKLSFTFPRILVQIINEAFFAVEDKVASEKDIDTAMLFGVNYPKGPVTWGKEAGLEHVVTLLEELHHIKNEERYRVCHLLKQLI